MVRVLTQSAARRFLIHALGLERPQALADVVTTVDRLEFVQMDPINACGRMHDLILQSRIAGYRPAMLDAALYTAPRRLFEYWFPNLCALPMRDYPYFVSEMKRRGEAPGRWAGLHPHEAPVAEQLLALIRDSGPIRARSGGKEHGHIVGAWGVRQTVATHLLEKMWRGGRLTIHHRENFERWFDLTEQALPEQARLHADGGDLPDAGERERYLSLKRLRARRLFRPKAADIAALGKDAVLPVRIEGATRDWAVLAEDTELVERAAELPVSDEVNILAPLEPLIYDRERTRAVFNFDYTWEVYTPLVKRRWGYYVLPLLQGERLIGRMDPKIERATGTLRLNLLALEEGVDPGAVARPIAARLRSYAAFLGMERIDLDVVTPESARAAIDAALDAT